MGNHQKLENSTTNTKKKAAAIIQADRWYEDGDKDWPDERVDQDLQNYLPDKRCLQAFKM